MVAALVLVAVLAAGANAGWSVGGSSPKFSVAFTESGLPGGTKWAVTLGGSLESSTGSSLSYSESGGTYRYTVGEVAGYLAHPSSGSAVVDGTGFGVWVAYTPVTYSVGFSESGLPSGQTFSVTFHGVTDTITTDGGTDSVGFSAPNGTYGYSIAGIAGWQQATLAGGGEVVVDGAAVTEVTLVYTPVTYSVTFSESGLTTGTSWSVTLEGSLESSTGTTIVFAEPNGTFGYAVGTVSGYTSDPSSGTIPVDGSAAGVSVEFTATSAYELGMAPTLNFGTPSTWGDILALSPTSGLMTDMFGLVVTTPGGIAVPVAGPSGTDCSVSGVTHVPSACLGTAGGWYAVLVSPSTGYIVALYSGPIPGWTYAGGVTTIALNNGYSLWVITAIPFAGEGYTMSAFSTGAAQVSGSTWL
ncbi:MAG: hypothetical protein ACLQC7_07230 [Thermoplasmata archaeon]